jgi:hypothetical protein
MQQQQQQQQQQHAAAVLLCKKAIRPGILKLAKKSATFCAKKVVVGIGGGTWHFLLLFQNNLLFCTELIYLHTDSRRRSDKRNFYR